MSEESEKNGSSKTSKWVIGIIIGLLTSMLTFMGGRYSVSNSIAEVKMVNSVQDEQIKTIRETMKEQGAQLDNIYTVVVNLDRKMSR